MYFLKNYVVDISVDRWYQQYAMNLSAKTINKKLVYQHEVTGWFRNSIVIGGTLTASSEVLIVSKYLFYFYSLILNNSLHSYEKYSWYKI